MKRLIPHEAVTKIEFVNKINKTIQKIQFESEIPADMPKGCYWKPYHILIEQFGEANCMERVKFTFTFVDEQEHTNPKNKDKYLNIYFKLDTWYTSPSVLIEQVRDIFKTCPIVNSEDMFYAYVTRTMDSFFKDYKNLNIKEFNKKYHD